MAKLVYSMITSLDGYVSATEGDIGSGANDEEVHTFIGETFRDVGTYLYGRRMYETMVFWETVHEQPDMPRYALEYGEIWRAADKVVYSTTLEEVASEKTRLERTFDPEAVRRMKVESDRALTIDGPTIAAHAIKAGLVDEYHLFITSTVVGGRKPFWPDGVRLELELVEQRSFKSGMLYARYRTRR